MPKLKNRYPKLCQDRNRAISWHNGERVYHGKWGTPEAEKSYKRFIAKLLENPALPIRDNKTDDVLVSELVAGFLDYIETRLDKTDFSHFKRAIGYLVDVYGGLSRKKFCHSIVSSIL